MDLYKFQRDALRTESKVSEIKTDKQEFLLVLEAFVLIANLLDGYKKSFFYNKDTKYQDLIRGTPVKLYAIAELLDTMQGYKNYKGAPDGKEVLQNIDTRAIHGMLGILTESGELAEILINYIKTGEIDVHNLSEELADGAGGTNSWYSAILCDVFGIDPNDPPDKVIRKLKIRFPEKYEDELADNRNLEAERKELES